MREPLCFRSECLFRTALEQMVQRGRDAAALQQASLDINVGEYF